MHNLNRHPTKLTKPVNEKFVQRYPFKRETLEEKSLSFTFSKSMGFAVAEGFFRFFISILRREKSRKQFHDSASASDEAKTPITSRVNHNSRRLGIQFRIFIVIVTHHNDISRDIVITRFVNNFIKEAQTGRLAIVSTSTYLLVICVIK